MISGSKIYKPYNDRILEEDMEKYAGEYVLIKGYNTTKEEIIGHNKKQKEIIKLAKKYDNGEVIINYIPPEDVIM